MTPVACPGGLLRSLCRPVMAACDDCWVADGARERREAIRQLAELRRRLAAAEDALTDALAATKQAEGAFDAASDRFDAAEHALDAAREERAQARRDRYTARQAYERASTTADRLARRVRELSERLDRAAELVAPRRRSGGSGRRGASVAPAVIPPPAGVGWSLAHISDLSLMTRWITAVGNLNFWRVRADRRLGT